MESTDFDILASPEGAALVERHLSSDPARVALKLRNPAVTQQIRVLQKCRAKLPTYYAARCIVSQLAYEQASSEATAAARTESLLEGIPVRERRTALDLTCGLGVDALALSRSFEQVVAVEIDSLRARIARWNFDRLGAANIEVVHDSAEHFTELRGAEQPMIDLVYVDPSRKTADGKRVYSLEDSAPQILDLLPALRKIARRVVVKLSPLFDVAEVCRQFGPETCVEVLSLDGECKEVLAKIGFATDGDDGRTVPAMRVTVIRRGEVRRFDFDRETLATPLPYPTDEPAESEPRFLLVPDVAFYKTRTVEAYRSQYLAQAGGLDLRLDGEYLFADELPDNFAGKTYRITFRHPYHPKTIARMLRSRGIRRINVHRRNFPFSAEEVARSLGVSLGGTTDIFCSTTSQNVPTLFFVLRID